MLPTFDREPPLNCTASPGNRNSPRGAAFSPADIGEPCGLRAPRTQRKIPAVRTSPSAPPRALRRSALAPSIDSRKPPILRAMSVAVRPGPLLSGRARHLQVPSTPPDNVRNRFRNFGSVSGGWTVTLPHLATWSTFDRSLPRLAGAVASRQGWKRVASRLRGPVTLDVVDDRDLMSEPDIAQSSGEAIVPVHSAEEMGPARAGSYVGLATPGLTGGDQNAPLRVREVGGIAADLVVSTKQLAEEQRTSPVPLDSRDGAVPGREDGIAGGIHVDAGFSTHHRLTYS